MLNEEHYSNKILMLCETFNATLGKQYTPQPAIDLNLNNGVFVFKIHVGKEVVFDIDAVNMTTQQACSCVESTIHAFIAGMKTQMLTLKSEELTMGARRELFKQVFADIDVKIEEMREEDARRRCD